MNKFLCILIISIFICNCSNETIYSGKILNQEKFKNINFENKQKLVNSLGEPSFIDPIEKKYFYYSEKKQKSSFSKEKIEYSLIFVFEFDKNNQIISSKVYDLQNKKSINIIENEITSQIVKKGLIEKIFGGVGAQQELPTTP